MILIETTMVSTVLLIVRTLLPLVPLIPLAASKVFRVLWVPLVLLVTNGTISKFTNGVIGIIPNALQILVTMLVFTVELNYTNHGCNSGNHACPLSRL